MATSIGDLALKLSASPANLVAGLSSGEKRLNQFGSAVDRKMADVQKSFSKPLGNVKMPGLDAIKNKIDGIGASASRVGKGGMGAGVGNALGGVAAGMGMGGFMTPMAGVGIAMAGAAKVGIDFERSMSRVKALTSATGEEFDSLRNLAMKLGRDTEFSATEAAQGMSAFALSGFKTKEILDAMKPTLHLASAGLISISEAADISATMLRAHRLPVEDLTRIVDELAFGMSNATTNMHELAEANKMVSATARIAGLSTGEQTAAIMMLSDQGIRGTEAGTALRNMLKKSSDQSDEARQMMKALGLSFHDDAGNFIGFGRALDMLNEKLAKFGDIQKSDVIGTLFEIRAGTGFSSILDQGKKYDELVKGFNRGRNRGVAESISTTQIDNTWGRLKIMFSTLQDTGIKTFDTLKGPINGVVETVGALAKVIGNVVVGFGRFTEAIGLAGLLRTSFSAVGDVLGFVVDVTGKAAEGWKLAAEALKGISTSAEETVRNLPGLTGQFLRGIDEQIRQPLISLEQMGKKFNGLAESLMKNEPLVDAMRKSPQMKDMFGDIPDLTSVLNKTITVKDAITEIPGLMDMLKPTPGFLEAMEKNLSLKTFLEQLKAGGTEVQILGKTLAELPNLAEFLDQRINLGDAMKSLPALRKAFEAMPSIPIKIALLTGDSLNKPTNLMPEKAITKATDTKQWMDRERLLLDTSEALKRQLATAQEGIATTTQLADGATMLEKAWQGVTHATKDFAGVLDAMKRLGATEDQMKPIKALQEQVRQTMLSEKLLGEKSRLFQDTRTPAETFKAQLNDITGLFDKGILDADLYTRSLVKLSDGFLGAGNAAAAMREASMFAGAAVLKGSAEAISITQRSRFEDKNAANNPVRDALERLRKEQEAQTNVNKAQLEEARKLLPELKKLLAGDKIAKG